VIRRKQAEARLFYVSEDICRPRKGLYSRIDHAVGDWEALSIPIRSAFSQERNGRPTDPVVFLKIYIVGYLENISDDTALAERIADSLSIRAFLGYGLDEATPDHSSISRVRGRLCGLEEVLENVVKLCASAGLVGGAECALDSTLIKANACPSSLKHGETGESVRQYVARLEQEDSSAKVRVKNSDFLSATDPDARLAKKPSSPANLYYKATHVTDAKSQVILSAACSRADVHDTNCAEGPIRQAAQTLKKSDRALQTLVADSAYDDGELHALVESLGAVPITNHYPRKREGQIPKSDFRYDSERDLYICPIGHHLLRVRQEPERSQYRSNEKVCQDCPFKSGCIHSGNARLITRSAHEEARNRNIERTQTKEGKRALARRKQVVEPPFAHMKRFGGLRRLNCRTLERAHVKILGAAIAWNLKKLAACVTAPARAPKQAQKAAFHPLHDLINMQKAANPAPRRPAPSKAFRLGA